MTCGGGGGGREDSRNGKPRSEFFFFEEFFFNLCMTSKKWGFSFFLVWCDLYFPPGAVMSPCLKQMTFYFFIIRETCLCSYFYIYFLVRGDGILGGGGGLCEMVPCIQGIPSLNYPCKQGENATGFPVKIPKKAVFFFPLLSSSLFPPRVIINFPSSKFTMGWDDQWLSKQIRRASRRKAWAWLYQVCILDFRF